MYEIVIGRDETDRKRFGNSGTILIGKLYVTMGQTTSLSNEVLMDVNRSHIVFICGKRGSGKSYTMGVIAEGMVHLPEEISSNLAIIIFDTMGIYWTMKYPNQKDEALLDEWNLKGKALDIEIFTPAGFYQSYKERGIPTDHPFSIKPSDLDSSEWCMTFGIDVNDPIGVLIQRVISKLKESSESFSMDNIIAAIKAEPDVNADVRLATESRFIAAQKWGLFSEEGTEIKDLVKGGQVTVLDVSCYTTSAGSEGIRSLVIGLVAQKLFIQRMVVRKKEEYESIHHSIHYFEEEKGKERTPLVWLIVDEAHEFLPNEGMTPATKPLITVLREGRQPGISLVLASQQPGKIHTDVMTQSDIVISHRLTAHLDVQALGALTQSYMREGLDKHISTLPRVKGAAVIFDDINERVYPMKVRPRLTWHGGEAPSAIQEKKKVISFKI